MKDIENYMLNVKQQLYCNASDEYKNECVTYNYTDELVDKHTDYFISCMNENLSAYKALLFFDDYLHSNPK